MTHARTQTAEIPKTLKVRMLRQMISIRRFEEEVERRPLLLVRAEVAGTEIGLVLQNAETIRLTAPDGKPVSVAVLKPGDHVLSYRMGGARHFGMKIQETLKER